MLRLSAGVCMCQRAGLHLPHSSSEDLSSSSGWCFWSFFFPPLSLGAERSFWLERLGGFVAVCVCVCVCVHKCVTSGNISNPYMPAQPPATPSSSLAPAPQGNSSLNVLLMSHRKCQLYKENLSSRKTQKAFLCLWDKEEEKCIFLYHMNPSMPGMSCPARGCCSSAKASGRSLCVLSLWMKLSLWWLCDMIGDHNGCSTRLHTSDESSHLLFVRGRKTRVGRGILKMPFVEKACNYTFMKSWPRVEELHRSFP